MKQASYIAKIGNDVNEDLSFEDFRSVRAKSDYAAFLTVANALVPVTTLAKSTEESFQLNKPTTRKLFRKLYNVMFNTLSRSGMKYVQVPRENK